MLSFTQDGKNRDPSKAETILSISGWQTKLKLFCPSRDDKQS